MKTLISLYALLLLFSACSTRDSGLGNEDATNSSVIPCAPLPTLGQGSYANLAKPDWTYDFTTKTELDRTIWTPEVTMSGGGNFEFEAYVDSPQTIQVSGSGLSLRADLMENYAVPNPPANKFQTCQTQFNYPSSNIGVVEPECYSPGLCYVTEDGPGPGCLDSCTADGGVAGPGCLGKLPCILHGGTPSSSCPPGCQILPKGPTNPCFFEKLCYQKNNGPSAGCPKTCTFDSTGQPIGCKGQGICVLTPTTQSSYCPTGCILVNNTPSPECNLPQTNICVVDKNGPVQGSGCPSNCLLASYSRVRASNPSSEPQNKCLVSEGEPQTCGYPGDEAQQCCEGKAPAPSCIQSPCGNLTANQSILGGKFIAAETPASMPVLTGISSLQDWQIQGCPSEAVFVSRGRKPCNDEVVRYGLNLGKDCTDDGSIYNLGYCACQAVTGYAVGATGKTTIVPPVISGRISMKQARKQAGEAYDISKGFLYGRIEIKAKIPRGDWLWPAMWMLPINNNNLGVTVNPQNPAGQGRYGVWPRSGEIDILESRGNSAKCSEAYMNTHPGEAFGGVQSFASTLHWGPYFKQNSFYKTHSEHYTDHGYVAGTTTRETLDQDFHVYGLRWSPLGIYTYIDHDDNRVLEVDFVKPFPQNGNSGFYHRGTQASSWCQQRFSHRGGQPTGINTCEEFIQELEEDIIAWLENPWEIGAGVCNPVAAPFDQPFYLIFNLAVGGTAGEGRDAYFPQGWCDKPWRNTEGYAVSDFITAKDQWYPSWQKGTPALQIQEIKYWKEENAGTFFALGPNAS